MEKQNYNGVITANISAQEAVDAINDLTKWWTEDFEGTAEKPGDMFTVRFGNIYKVFKVTEVVPGKKLVWEVIDSHLPFVSNLTEWTGTSLEWEITTKGNSTQVSMTHVGLSPEVECYTQCEKGWDYFLKESLYKLLTEQKGLPHKLKINA